MSDIEQDQDGRPAKVIAQTREASPIIKRSISIAGRNTSVSLEEEFWLELRRFAVETSKTVSEAVAQIEGQRENVNLSSAIRTFLFRRALAGREFSPSDSGEEPPET